MYTTLDIIIVCVLGGCALALYLACIQHYRELKVVQNAYRDAVDELEQMLVSEEYNGWINRETWAFMLWQSGTSAMYDLMRDLSAQIAVKQGIFEHEGDAKGNISNRGMTDIQKRNLGAEYVKEWSDYANQLIVEVEEGDFYMALQDIGSMWRVDPESVGDALEEHVREVLFDGFNIAIVNEEDYCDLLR